MIVRGYTAIIWGIYLNFSQASKGNIQLHPKIKIYNHHITVTFAEWMYSSHRMISFFWSLYDLYLMPSSAHLSWNISHYSFCSATIRSHCQLDGQYKSNHSLHFNQSWCEYSPLWEYGRYYVLDSSTFIWQHWKLNATEGIVALSQWRDTWRCSSNYFVFCIFLFI